MWGALRRKPRATEPNPELGVVEPAIERKPGIIELVCRTREMRSNRSGKNGRKKGKEATGKTGENTTATLRRGKRNRASQPDRECIGEGGEPEMGQT